MKHFKTYFAAVTAAILLSVPVFSQETELTVVDMGVVQVNDVVITLSRINREIDNAVESLVREGNSREAAKAEIESRKGRLIASLIEEELIMQKGKELGMERDVEARINQQFLQQRDELKLKSLDELYALMRQQGVEPDDVRASLRSQITREWVFQSQVDDQVRWNISDEDVKSYFDANKSKFTEPATITLSEIFLSFAGRSPDAVRQRAKDIVAQLRGGSEFAKIAIENSDRPNVEETKGSVGTVEVAQLAEVFKTPLENARVGDVTDPIELDEGIEILRVDGRTAQGTESNFDENKVKIAILTERIPPARKKYIEVLKDDAYIKISDTYRPIVSPFLQGEDAGATASK